MNDLTIGQLAKQVKLNTETIRYYERRGLIPEPARRASGYRQYSEGDVFRLQFIQRAKALGFSLGEIKELMWLRADPDSTSGDFKERAQRKIEQIDEKIAELERFRKALAKLAATCPGNGSAEECPILQALET